MKIIPALILLLLCIDCGQEKKGKNMLFDPKNKITYHFEMLSDQLNMNGTFDADYIKKNDTIDMTIEVKDMSAKTKDNQDLGYNEFIGSSYTRKYNKFGKPVDLLDLPTQIVNTDLFLIEYPNKPITEGMIWKAKKTANPDMFFAYIDVEYKCTSIKDDFIFIDAKMDFKSANEENTDLKFTRKYNGEYIVDAKNGVVNNAQLSMDMFSGISQLTGTFEIRKL